MTTALLQKKAGNFFCGIKSLFYSFDFYAVTPDFSYSADSDSSTDSDDEK